MGGPTHVHGMSRESTRKSALDAAGKPGNALHVDQDAAQAGLRDWFESFGTVHAMGAAFDTRVDAPAMVTGHASKAIDKRLGQHGLDLIVKPESFLVDKQNHLLPGEQRRALVWGEFLAHTLVALSATR